MKPSHLKRLATLLVLVASFARGSAAFAEQGITDQEIVIGSTGSLTGLNAQGGTQMRAGINAYLRKVNAAGGVNGRQIRYVPLDDGYEPGRALDNVKKLWEEEKIFALVGGNGTAIAKAILPYVKTHKIPFLFTYSGGEFLYEPVEPTVFQLRVGYQKEAELLTRYAVKKLGLKKIGVVFQDDAFGIAGKSGVARTLVDLGLKTDGESSYKRNSASLQPTLDAIRKFSPEAVYLQMVTSPASALLRAASEQSFRPVFLATSAADSLSLADSLKARAGDLYGSEVMPLPEDTRYAIVRQFLADAKGTEAHTAHALEGYVDAVVFVEAVKRAGRDLTHAKLYGALEAMHDVDFGGLKVTFKPSDHGGLDRTWIYHHVDGKSVEVTN